MTTSTTLMTFLVDTPPSTNSVELFGSWDNFGRGYSMVRDSRRGSEHWTGCHLFENIICDGRAGRISSPRKGGLRMGGTYWYYFQLDHDREHHNPAVPSTTNCPLLPGQPVNVLEVPVQFSGRRHRQRNGTICSACSERRTMNPSDKFVNPRPAPGPDSPRCDISVPWEARRTATSTSTRRQNVSLPNTSHAAGSIDLTRKGSVDGGGRSSQKRSGIKATLRQLTSGKGTNDTNIRGRSSLPSDAHKTLRKPRSPPSRAPTSVSAPTSRPSSRRGPTPEMERAKAVDNGLALRRALETMAQEDRLPSSSFRHHRRQRSHSREPSPLRGPSALTEKSRKEVVPKDVNGLQYHPLEPLKEVISPQKHPRPEKSKEASVDKAVVSISIPERLQKELPLIPVSPLSSSLQDVSRTSCEIHISYKAVKSMIVSPEGPIESLAGLLSRDRRIQDARCRLNSSSTLSSSLWSSRLLDMKSPPLSQATSRSSYPMSPYEIPQFPPTPKSALYKRRSTPIFESYRIPSIISSSTLSSDGNNSPSSPGSEASETRTDRHALPSSLQKRYGMLLAPQQNYRLPEEASPSITSKWQGESIGRVDEDSTTFSQNTNIHQILHDLSYLGNAIQD